jgi:hypothetical protein
MDTLCKALGVPSASLLWFQLRAFSDERTHILCWPVEKFDRSFGLSVRSRTEKLSALQAIGAVKDVEIGGGQIRVEVRPVAEVATQRAGCLPDLC